jgi:hypothetical protein
MCALHQRCAAVDLDGRWLSPDPFKVTDGLDLQRACDPQMLGAVETVRLKT